MSVLINGFYGFDGMHLTNKILFQADLSRLQCLGQPRKSMAPFTAGFHPSAKIAQGLGPLTMLNMLSCLRTHMIFDLHDTFEPFLMRIRTTDSSKMYQSMSSYIITSSHLQPSPCFMAFLSFTEEQLRQIPYSTLRMSRQQLCSLTTA